MLLKFLGRTILEATRSLELLLGRQRLLWLLKWAHETLVKPGLTGLLLDLPLKLVSVPSQAME